jgi:hypothetical protein
MTETDLKPCGTLVGVGRLQKWANRCKSCGTFVSAKARWIWRHRTKAIGGIGVCAGAVQYQLANHPEIRLPHEGVLLMGFGAAVGIVGAYNSIAQFFGWTDPQ